MGEIIHGLGDTNVIGLDTAVLIYYIEADPDYSPAVRAVLESVQAGELRAIASTLLLSELIVLPFRHNRPDIAVRYENTLIGFPNLRITPVDRETARTAARIRGRYGFRLPDAVHLATALEHDADTFITNDRRLQQFHEIRVTLLSDFVH